VDVLDAILSRRSCGRLLAPAPSDAELQQLLAAAAAAPDHGSLRPFRFIVLRPSVYAEFGAVLAAAYEARCAARGVPAEPAKVEKDHVKLGRAPLVVVVAAVHVASPKIPFSEQEDAAAAAVENLLLAAVGLGYGSMWRTGDEARDPAVKAALGLSPDDAIVGFVYLGTRPDGPQSFVPRPPPPTEGLITEWTP
jgi:nitroreductase